MSREIGKRACLHVLKQNAAYNYESLWKNAPLLLPTRPGRNWQMMKLIPYEIHAAQLTPVRASLSSHRKVTSVPTCAKTKSCIQLSKSLKERTSTVTYKTCCPELKFEWSNCSHIKFVLASSHCQFAPVYHLVGKWQACVCAYTCARPGIVVYTVFFLYLWTNSCLF